MVSLLTVKHQWNVITKISTTFDLGMPTSQELITKWIKYKLENNSTIISNENLIIENKLKYRNELKRKPQDWKMLVKSSDDTVISAV